MKSKDVNKKAVVVLSGGMDSTTLAYYLKNKGYDLYAISFDYGQKHSKELEAAKTIANALQIPCTVVDISSIKPLLKSALTRSDTEIPEGHYAGENMKATVVPNRNMIMLSIAAGYAGSLGAQSIAFAAHGGDHFIYPDCRPQFVEGMNVALLASFDAPEPKVIDPFITIDKTDIVRLGSSLGVPYELTWSCYVGKEKHCGKCGTCVERREAFELAGVKDLTEYGKSNR